MKKNLPTNQSNFLLYTGNDGKINVEVFLKDETVWLTQKAMSELFGVNIPAISKRLSNIFESGELQRKASLSILETVQAVIVSIDVCIVVVMFNALSSPIMIRIHFDILWTLIADTLYHRFAQDLRRFETNIAPTIFRKFIDMLGRVVYDGNKFAIKIRKRAHTPVLKEVEKLQKPFKVPWLSGKIVEIAWALKISDPLIPRISDPLYAQG